MNNLTKIAALPTGGGCQCALRPEDRGAAFATGGPVSPSAVILDREDGPELRAPLGLPQQFVLILIGMDMAKRESVTVVHTFSVGDVATRTMVQSAVGAYIRRAKRFVPEGTC